MSDQCTCDRCMQERFHEGHYAQIMRAAKPAYDAIAALVQANYQLANELLEVTKERDRLLADTHETDETR